MVPCARPIPGPTPPAPAATLCTSAELAADAGILFHGIGGFALQFEDAPRRQFSPSTGGRLCRPVYSGCRCTTLSTRWRLCTYWSQSVPHPYRCVRAGSVRRPGQPSRVVAVPPQGQAFFGFGQVFVNLFVYLFRRGAWARWHRGGFHYL